MHHNPILWYTLQSYIYFYLGVEKGNFTSPKTIICNHKTCADSLGLERLHIYTIIRHKSVDVRKLQVAILALSPREMSQIDRILPRYILSRVCVSVWLRIRPKKTQTTVDHRSAADIQLNWNGHNPFSWVAQRQEFSAKTLLWSAAIRVQTPCREQYFFHFYCLRLTRLTFNKS